MTLTLRPYQQDAVDAVQHKLATNRCALVATCVGSGKSLIIAEIAKKYKRAVIVQPAQELVTQNYNKLVHSGLDCTMIDGARKGNWDADFIFTTPQTLTKNLERITEPDILFADEVHWGYIGKMWKEIREQWGEAKLVGLTATPRYYEQKVIYKDGWMWSVTTCRSLAADIFGEPVIDIDRQTLLEMGFGRPIGMHKIPIARAGAEHIDNLEVYGHFVKRHLDELFDHLRTIDNALIYCDSKSHAQLLNKQSANSIRLLLGTTPKKERMQLIQDFLAGSVRFIATVGCGKIGLDLPNLTDIVILTNVGNPDLLEQMVGRLNRGTCYKNCWFNSTLNTAKPVVGQQSRVRIKALR